MAREYTLAEPETTLRELVNALPKAELHVHLEGSVDAATIQELHPALSLDVIQENLQYSGFAGFLKAYVWTTRQLDSPAAYALATRRLIDKLSAQNVQYAEITLSAGVILWKQQNVEEIFEAIHSEASRPNGIEIAWIFDAIRQFGVEEAARVFAIAKKYRGDGVVGIGIGGDEERGPAAWFEDLYRDAKDAGLGLTCHAGEASGAGSVWQAVNIGAQRIGHGIRSIEDPELSTDPARTRYPVGSLPLEQCMHGSRQQPPGTSAAASLGCRSAHRARRG